MNLVVINLPIGEHEQWADEAISSLVGQQTTVIDLEGREHRGMIMSAARSDTAVRMMIETDAPAPNDQDVLALSIEA